MANTIRTAKGRHTRQTILNTAVQLASTEGLDHLTIGRLAAELEMSKSGLFAHFGSKESLQLSTIEAAVEIFRAEVIQPARHYERGLARLWGVCNTFLDYEEQKIFGGGCFFATVTSEFKGRPGLIRETLILKMKDWLSFLNALIQDAQRLGQLHEDVDPRQLVYELQALFMGANWFDQLFEEPRTIDLVRSAIRQRLAQIAYPHTRPLLDGMPVPARKE